MNAIPQNATIVELLPLSDDTTLLCLSLDDPGQSDLHTCAPGRFVQLSVPAGGEAPISIAGIRDACTLELCVKRVGKVTALLHNVRPGDRVGVRGPFGNGFPVAELEERDVLLLAGGLGIAPLRSLLHYLLAHRDHYGAITLMYGARETAAILFREELVRLAAGNDVRILLTVDFVREEEPQGFACNVGLLPSLLEGIRFDGRNTCAALCGPPALYGCTVDSLLAAGCAAERIFISLERRMQCGQGYCSHCAVGELLCCTNGPVFRYGDIKEIPGAL
jgi:NAD(P)H-flavin reductase